jgi:hypothetical protein
MIRIASALVILAALVPSVPAEAGSMHQSPELRRNQKRMCPNGKPMTTVRTGRTRIFGC